MSNPPQAKSIAEVIEILEGIIHDSMEEQSPLGYFAVLYQKVTLKVKQGITDNFFDDGQLMEKLDIVFAQRYLDAYFLYKSNEPTTLSWKRAFDLSTDYWPIVLQHLLIGMNAHISLDLGIAAAQVSKGQDIDNLKGDFDKINDILSSLVNEVQNDLAEIWPKLKWILSKTKKVDDFLVDFSMELARDGAWNFAKQLADSANQDDLVIARDEKVAKASNIITNPGLIANLILGIIRIGERGSVSEKIDKLKQ